MQTQNRFFDDLTRMAGGAVGALGGVKGEIEALVRQQFERILRDMDMVSRDEFEAVRAMASQARAEQEVLASLLDELRNTTVNVSASKPATAPKDPKPLITPIRAARLRQAARKKRLK